MNKLFTAFVFTTVALIVLPACGKSKKAQVAKDVEPTEQVANTSNSDKEEYSI